MWAFLSRRFRRWALFALAVPVGRRVLEMLRDRSARSRGHASRLTKALDQAGQAVGSLDRRGRRRRGW